MNDECDGEQQLGFCTWFEVVGKLLCFFILRRILQLQVLFLFFLCSLPL